MEYVPLIYLNGEKHTSKEKKYIDEILDIDKFKIIYIIDEFGLKKNKPNLSIYQKLSNTFELWIDGGPRNLGDFVDMVLVGALKITIRRNLWMDFSIESIREISENKLFLNVDLNIPEKLNDDNHFTANFDGLVFFNNTNQIRNGFKKLSLLKKICLKNNLYVYELNPKNIQYWKRMGVVGLLIDINRIKEFEND